MRLHENSDLLEELISATATSLGLPEVFVEKDYWITKGLKHLSDSEYSASAVFKGGTSLSKAYGLIERFSEDIDIAIFSDGLGDSQRKRMLKNVENAASQGLTPIAGDDRESKGSSYRKTVYGYPKKEGGEFYQATPELIVEVNAFTYPEPHEVRQIQSLVAEYLAKRGHNDIIAEYSLEPFELNVLSVRRTLVEKILCVAKHSAVEDPINHLAVRVRHLYDITMILRQSDLRKFVSGKGFAELSKHCIAEDKATMGGWTTDVQVTDIKATPIFDMPLEWGPKLLNTYKGEFAELVIGELPDFEEILDSLSFIKRHLP